MSSHNGVQPPANTPSQEISIDTAFKDLEKAIEITDPYGGPTLPVTPVRTPDSISIMSIPATGESRPGTSPMEQRKENFRSDSMQKLWHRIEDKAARTRFQSQEANAGWFSRLTFHWASKLLWVRLTLWLTKFIAMFD